MDFFCSCSCNCRFFARYTKGSVVTPQHSTLSRQEQALEFCNVCVSDVASEGFPSTKPEESEWLGVQLHHFFKDLFLLAVGCPFIFFVCLIPLWFADGAIYEFWRTYYFFWMFLPSAWFGRNLMVVSWGRGPQLRSVVISAMAASICGTVIAGISRSTQLLSFSIDVGTVFVLLYLPALHIYFVRNDAHYNTMNFVLYLTGLSAGAVPCGMSGFLYYLVMESTLSRNLTIFVCFGMWVCSNGLLKSVGKRIWAHAAPSCKVFGVVIWVFFTEVAMNCLGIRIFFESVWSALLFSTSFLMLAAMQLLRGTEKYYAAKPTLETIGVHRLSILMETFATCVGRLAALTMYVCFTSLQLATGRQTESISRTMPSLFGTPLESALSIDIYKNSDVDTSTPWMGIIGMAVVVSTFALFTASATRVWATGSAFQVRVVPAGADLHQSPPQSPTTFGAGAEATASTEPMGFVAARDAAAHGPPRWWDELYPGEFKISQFDLLSSFVAQYWSQLLSIVSFVFALSSLMVNAVEFLRFGVVGMPSC